MAVKSKGRILVIEDDAHIAEGLRLNLALQGYEVEIAADGGGGLRKWREMRPDLIVLDVMLPGIDGLSVLRSIRLEDDRLPILILSARSASEDRIRGLSFGVDDYIGKPFELDEFLLRVERLITRAGWSRDAEGPGAPLLKTFSFGDNRIDFETATAKCQSGRIVLTDQEARLLKLFVMNPGKPLSRAKLLEIGWGYSSRTSTRTVDNFIVRLRRYFEPDPKRPVYFKSLRSVGYVFEPSPDAAGETR
jgi:DNA-binding response OmpR family regulator